jgi:S1-C subfamily serine protease
VTTALLLAPAVVSADETESTTYSHVEPSLALVVAGHGKNTVFGSAFCIADIGNSNGYVLTNRHVVQNDQHPDVMLMSNPKVLTATVVRTSPLDAAVLLIPSDCRPLNLSSDPPPVGTRIALAGFPSIQIHAAFAGLGLSPSFHEGTISSILASGSELEYDAQTDHGNSGSPLFDVDTGTVYGLVTAASTGETGALQNNFAVGIWTLAPFLQNAHAMASYINGGGSIQSGRAAQRDTSLPDDATQKALTAAYTQRCTAAFDPSDVNLDAAFGVLAPEFVGIDPKGKQVTRNEVVAQGKRQLKMLRATACDNKIESFTLADPNTVLVVNTFHLEGDIQAPDGKHDLLLTEKSQDTWKNEGGKWLVAQSKDSRLLVTIDGNVVQNQGGL